MRACAKGRTAKLSPGAVPVADTVNTLLYVEKGPFAGPSRRLDLRARSSRCGRNSADSAGRVERHWPETCGLFRSRGSCRPPWYSFVITCASPWSAMVLDLD